VARRPSLETLLVLGALLDARKDGVNEMLFGREIADRTGLLPGTTYPILHRLISQKIVIDKWEVEEPEKLGRPRKRFYKLSDEGAHWASEMLRERASASPRMSSILAWRAP
jgi:PadR family transcriptional regulator PadR